MLGTILLIILILLLVGALPTWPHSSGWGYYPSGGLGLILIIVLILVLMGRISASRARHKRWGRGRSATFPAGRHHVVGGGRTCAPVARRIILRAQLQPCL